MANEYALYAQQKHDFTNQDNGHIMICFLANYKNGIIYGIAA